eukprot:4425-Eustigmatos_ZCMA.PRE.1
MEARRQGLWWADRLSLYLHVRICVYLCRCAHLSPCVGIYYVTPCVQLVELALSGKYDALLLDRDLPGADLFK